MNIASGHSFPNRNSKLDYEWLLSLIRRLRPDICGADPKKEKFLKWLILAAIREYTALAENQVFKDILNTPVNNSAVTQLQAWLYKFREDVRQNLSPENNTQGFINWFYQHGIDEHGLIPVLNQKEKNIYFQLHPQKGDSLKSTAAKPAQNLKFGVNLIGYAFGQLGIGEDLRMTARALQEANIPFTIINFPPGSEVHQNDRSMEQFVGEEAPYNINIFCMTALELGRFYAEKGSSSFTGRYNIGYWPWELSQWPAEWLDLARLVDEVWVSSRHIYDALAPECDVPVLVMPLAVDTSEVSSLTRHDFNLPEQAYLFCFSFDFNSSMARKNPEACLKAFQMAFPAGDKKNKNVGLVIKCNRPKSAHPAWDKLKGEAAKDKRIKIIEGMLPRPDLLALYKCCDCFLSLHRAEGYGRNIAEALMLGLDVIATGYSGNVDYCQSQPRAFLADYKLVPIKAGDYPYGDGKLWSNPDIAHAARLMRERVDDQGVAQPHDFPFSINNAGQKYAQRLKFIQTWQENASRYATEDKGQCPCDEKAQAASDQKPGLDALSAPIKINLGNGECALFKIDLLLVVNGFWVVAGWISRSLEICLEEDGRKIQEVEFDTFMRPDVNDCLGTNENIKHGFAIAAACQDVHKLDIELHAPDSEKSIKISLNPQNASKEIDSTHKTLLGDKIYELVAGAQKSGQQIVVLENIPVEYCIEKIIRWPDKNNGSPLLVVGWLAAPENMELSFTPAPLSQKIVYFDRADIARSRDIFINSSSRGNGFIACLHGINFSEKRINAALLQNGETFGFSSRHIIDFYGFRDFLKAIFEIPINSNELARVYAESLLPWLGDLASSRCSRILHAAHREGQAGNPNSSPSVSIIIPLYGSLDLLEKQIQCLAADVETRLKSEIIYVIDDPDIYDEFQLRIHNLSSRHKLPLRWIFWNGSQGFAGACNLGASIASGEYLVFMNSDVFPEKAGWIQAFKACLAADPSIGIVGYKLMYPDGKIQHCGVEFQLDESMNIWLCEHPACEPASNREGHKKKYICVKAVTGACIAVRKNEFIEIGRWNTQYLIGGYEDMDLCLTYATKNKKIACIMDQYFTHWGHHTFNALGENGWMNCVAVFNAVEFGAKWDKEYGYHTIL